MASHDGCQIGISAEEFELAILEYRPFLVNLAWKWLGSRELAEDVVQDSLAYLWTRLDAYDPQRGSLGQWLGKCVGNRIRNANRDRKYDPKNDGLAIYHGISQPGQDSHFRVNQVLDQVSYMTGPMREVMDLFILGLDVKEISKGLGITRKKAQYWVDKGLDKLRKRVR